MEMSLPRQLTQHGLSGVKIINVIRRNIHVEQKQTIEHMNASVETMCNIKLSLFFRDGLSSMSFPYQTCGLALKSSTGFLKVGDPLIHLLSDRTSVTASISHLSLFTVTAVCW